VSVTCYDRMAALADEDSAIDSFRTSIRGFLEKAFAAANDRLDIVLYLDVDATDVNGSTADTDRLVPFDGVAKEYSPQTSEPNGLPGDSLRAQLDALCQSFLATSYQDVRLGAWSVMDVPSVGASVDAVRYDGTSWRPFTVPEQTVMVDRMSDEDEDQLEAMPSTVEVCSEINNLTIDPDFEQFTALATDDALFHWSHPGSDVVELGIFGGTDKTIVDTDSGQSISQVIPIEFLVGNLTTFVLRLVTDNNNGSYDLTTTLTYGDGSTVNNTVSISDHNDKTDEGNFIYNTYHPIDQSKDRITEAEVRVDVTGGSPAGNPIRLKLQGLVEDVVTRPDGNTVTKRRVSDRLCFRAKGGAGRRSVDDDRGSALTELSTGRASPVEWNSDKYSGPYSRLWIWRAVQILALQPPGYQKLKSRVPDELVPLGTRIQWSKPGERERSTFVPLKGRVLHLAGDEGTSTELKDVEIPDAVIDLI